jgi:hypothetical protein
MKALNRPFATANERQRARDAHATDDCEIDDDAVTSVAEDGTGLWVSAWVWIDAEVD